MVSKDREYFERRAQAEIAIAKAAGASKAYASSDNRTVFVERRDGTKEVVRLQKPDVTH
ncbi:MAG TPA: hypothetical protein VG841_03985 [Caulobacterales bacterium]|nr:hypothetical protein [Caulobacterales bacterium]